MARWRDLAEEARARANEMIHPETKQLMLTIAKCYERMAELAEYQIMVEALFKPSDTKAFAAAAFGQR
jgi:hypothetical protein